MGYSHLIYIEKKLSLARICNSRQQILLLRYATLHCANS